MTLPTRADGGIDWGKLEAATPIMISSAAMRVLGEQIAAYERERCAKIAEAPDGPDPDGNIAAAIRKMED